MSSAPLFILILVAIAIGWLLGKHSSRSRGNAPRSSDYYKGLNYLLDGRPDGALDEFIESLEVSSQTFETHISLGNLLRKKGEVQRAIRVHENVLAHGDLPASYQHEAHLELARDYIAAGLLDRGRHARQARRAHAGGAAAGRLQVHGPELLSGRCRPEPATPPPDNSRC